MQLEKINFWGIIKNLDFNISENVFNNLNFEDPIFKDNEYILTTEVKEKLSQLYVYMKNQIQCILEGETGTSKNF